MAPVGFIESKHIFVTPLSPAMQSAREIASKAQEAEAKTLEDAMRKHVTSEAATPKQDPPALTHGSYDKPGVKYDNTDMNAALNHLTFVVDSDCGLFDKIPLEVRKRI
ncbi:hypothetical protein Vi05172_g3969 [Venturia inaequalis]|nr:hypothetical protein Vi05172_g3969 [Venturia inaequalis]